MEARLLEALAEARLVIGFLEGAEAQRGGGVSRLEGASGGLLRLGRLKDLAKTEEERLVTATVSQAIHL